MPHVSYHLNRHVIALLLTYVVIWNCIVIASDPVSYKLSGDDGNIRVYLINLDRRIERLRNCDKQLKRFGLTYTRFSAYDGRAITLRQYDQLPSPHPEMKFSLKAFMEDKENKCEEGCGESGMQI